MQSPGELCIASLSLLRKLIIDSAVLTSAGSLFHHSGAKTEKSSDFAVRPLLALSDGDTSRPAEVLELGHGV